MGNQGIEQTIWNKPPEEWMGCVICPRLAFQNGWDDFDMLLVGFDEKLIYFTVASDPKGDLVLAHSILFIQNFYERIQ